MACLDEIPITIERRRILFGAGTLIDPTPICKQIDDECCVDEGDPTCCDGEFARELAGTLSGPLDGSCGPESIPFTLTWDTTDERWYGEANNALATYSFRIWFRCVNGVYLGTVQVLDSDGALIDESPDITLGPTCDATPPTLDGAYTPEGDLAPCGDQVVVSIDHPCPTVCDTGVGPCCPDGYLTTISAEIATVGTATLLFDTEFGIWQGAVAVGDDSYVVTLWCNADGSWTAWIDLYTGGELIDSGTTDLAPGPDCTTLVGSVTVSGESLSVEYEHPCAPAPCGDPGGTIDLCGCTGVSETLYVTFAGVLASYGTLTLTYVNAFLGWVVTPGAGSCNGGTSPIAFNCTGGTTWILSTPGSGGTPSTSFSATAAATACSPLTVSFSGTATGGCAGAWTAIVSEIAP